MWLVWLGIKATNDATAWEYTDFNYYNCDLPLSWFSIRAIGYNGNISNYNGVIIMVSANGSVPDGPYLCEIQQVSHCCCVASLTCKVRRCETTKLMGAPHTPTL